MGSCPDTDIDPKKTNEVNMKNFVDKKVRSYG